MDIICTSTPTIIKVINQVDSNYWITIGLPILGWIIALWGNAVLQRLNLQDNAKVETYKTLANKYDEFQKTAISLSANLSYGFPFNLMSFDIDQVKNPLFVTGSNGQHDVSIAQMNGKLKAVNRAIEFSVTLSKSSDDFSAKFIEFWQTIEIWSALFGSLEVSKKTLTSEFSIISDRLNKYNLYISSLDKYNWQDWDKNDLESRKQVLLEDVSNFLFYTHDFMDLVNNELIVPLMGKNRKKLSRRVLDPKYKVLTKDGLAVILEKE